MESIACPLCHKTYKNLAAHMRLAHPESMPPKNPMLASQSVEATVKSDDSPPTPGESKVAESQQFNVDSLVAAIKTEITASLRDEIRTEIAAASKAILEESARIAQGQVKHTFDQLAAQVQAQQQGQGIQQGTPQAPPQGGGGNSWIEHLAKMIFQQAMAGQGGGGLGGQGGNQALLNQIAFLGQLQAALAKPAEEAAYRQQRNLIDILSISTKAEIPLDRTLAAMNEVVERGRPKEEGK